MPVYSVLQSVAVSGLAVAVSNRTAAAVACGRRGDAPQLLSAALRLLFGVWCGLCVLVFLFDQPLAVGVLGDGRTALALPCLLPCLLLTGVENLTKNHFYGLGETRLPAAVELAEQLIRAAAVLGLLRALMPLDGSHTVAVIVLGMGVSEVFSSSVLTLARLRRRDAAPLNACPEARAALLEVALPVSFTALLGNLMGAANSVLLPQLLEQSGMTSTEAMESFGVVFGMTMPLLTMPFALIGALSLAILPRLTGSAACDQRQKLHHYLQMALSTVSLFVLPAIALLVALGGVWGELLFQDDRVGDLLLPLSVGVALSAYESILGTILNGLGQQGRGAAISLLCGAVQLAITLLLTQQLGFYAYALGIALSSALGVLLRVRVMEATAQYHPQWFPLVGAPLLCALLLGSGAGLLFRVLRLHWPLLPASGLAALFGIGLYLLALLALGVPLGRFTPGAKRGRSATTPCSGNAAGTPPPLA
jgi:stage V sporulation protein B